MTAAEQTSPTFAVRPLETAEIPFVLDSWTRSFLDSARDAMPMLQELEPSKARLAQRVVAMRLVRRSTTMVAHVPGVPDEVCGYLVAEVCSTDVVPRSRVLILHWLYTKQPYRSAGVARTLLGEALLRADRAIAIAHSHETPAGRILMLKLKSKFNPQLAR